MKSDRIAALKEKYPDCVLLPVISKNKLPMALALSIGLPVYTKIQLIHAQSRKYLNAINRLVHTPEFEGKVRKGISYIIVDDVVTQGGTVSALRQFVVMRGGIVSAVVALAYAVGSRAIAPTRANIVHLISKFDRDKLIHILRTHDICDDFMQLTNSQIRYILRFKNVYTFNEKIDNYIN